jgi:hypothetical protein
LHHPCYKYQGAHNMPSSQGSYSMLHTPPLAPVSCPKHVWNGSWTCLEMPRWKEKKKEGAKGRPGEKKVAAVTLVLTALATPGICNVRALWPLEIPIPSRAASTHIINQLWLY